MRWSAGGCGRQVPPWGPLGPAELSSSQPCFSPGCAVPCPSQSPWELFRTFPELRHWPGRQVTGRGAAKASFLPPLPCRRCPVSPQTLSQSPAQAGQAPSPSMARLLGDPLQAERPVAKAGGGSAHPTWPSPPHCVCEWPRLWGPSVPNQWLRHQNPLVLATGVLRPPSWAGAWPLSPGVLPRSYCAPGHEFPLKRTESCWTRPPRTCWDSGPFCGSG